MKKLFVSISSLFAYLFLTVPAFAVEGPSIDPCTGQKNTIAQILCRLGGSGGTGTIASTISGVVVFFIILAVIIALVYLLYGGIKWITSGGDKEKVAESRNHIIAALLGLIVVILAVFLLTVVLAAFGISFSDLKIPVIGGQ